MTDKPSTPKATHGMANDSMSSANFQAIRAAKAKAAAPSPNAGSHTIEARHDSLSSTNFQSLASKAKPATTTAQPANTASTAPTSAKSVPARPPSR